MGEGERKPTVGRKTPEDGFQPVVKCGIVTLSKASNVTGERLYGKSRIIYFFVRSSRQGLVFNKKTTMAIKEGESKWQRKGRP